jgi:hypothetical protein
MSVHSSSWGGGGSDTAGGLARPQVACHWAGRVCTLASSRLAVERMPHSVGSSHCCCTQLLQLLQLLAAHLQQPQVADDGCVSQRRHQRVQHAGALQHIFVHCRAITGQHGGPASARHEG